MTEVSIPSRRRVGSSRWSTRLKPSRYECRCVGVVDIPTRFSGIGERFNGVL